MGVCGAACKSGLMVVSDNSLTQTSLSKTRDLLALVTGSIRRIWIQDSPPLGSSPGRFLLGETPCHRRHPPYKSLFLSAQANVPGRVLIRVTCPSLNQSVWP